MADSVHYSILEAVQAGIRGLGLSGMPQEKVVILTVPREIKFYTGNPPFIVITPFGSETINPSDGTTSKNDIGYPAFVGFIDKAKQDQTTKLKGWLEWRELVIAHFISDRLTLGHGVAGAGHGHDVTIEPGPVLDLGAWFQGNRFDSGLTLRVTVRR